VVETFLVGGALGPCIPQIAGASASLPSFWDWPSSMTESAANPGLSGLASAAS